MTGAGIGELESVRVARILRDDIVLGRRQPGSRLVERDIAAELQVSRLPVREAIRMLATEGIVVVRPRSFAVVRRFTLRDIRNFAEVREAVETLVFELAAQRHDAVGIERLRGVLARELAAAEAEDIPAGRAAAGDFHETVGQLAGNEMLGELIGALATRLRWVFGQHEDLAEMAEEHRVLLEALAARDVEALRTLVPQHLANGRRTAERQLLGASPGAVELPAG